MMSPIYKPSLNEPCQLRSSSLRSDHPWNNSPRFLDQTNTLRKIEQQKTEVKQDKFGGKRSIKDGTWMMQHLRMFSHEILKNCLVTLNAKSFASVAHSEMVFEISSQSIRSRKLTNWGNGLFPSIGPTSL